MRPSLYFVEYQDRAKVTAYLAEHPEDSTFDRIDPWSLMSHADAGDLEQAHILARRIAVEQGCTASVFYRDNIQDVTPTGDPPGLIFDWEIRHLQDVQP